MSGDGPWPEESSSHAACCLNYGQQHPQLLVTGGVNRQGKALEDAWVLDVDSGKWRKVRLNTAHTQRECNSVKCTLAKLV